MGRNSTDTSGTPLSCGIVGATSLLGRELGTALGEAGFNRLRLLRSPEEEAPASERKLTDFADEPALVEAFAPEQLADLDVLFLAGGANSARHALAAARNFPVTIPVTSPVTSPVTIIDLSGGLAGEAGAVTAGWNGVGRPAAASARVPARLMVVAHPAAQALAHMLAALDTLGPHRSCATVFEPASERGWDGIRELEQQTVRMLALQSQPQEVFGVQIAFNLRTQLGEAAAPSLEAVRARIAGELARLRAPASVAPALQLLQAPLFHASVISLYVQFTGQFTTLVNAAAVTAALSGPDTEWHEQDPDVTAVADADDADNARLHLGPPRGEAGAPGGFWLLATLDNLRRTAASAAACALELVQDRT